MYGCFHQGTFILTVEASYWNEASAYPSRDLFKHETVIVCKIHVENQPHPFSLHMMHCVRRARQRL